MAIPFGGGSREWIKKFIYAWCEKIKEGQENYYEWAKFNF